MVTRREAVQAIKRLLGAGLVLALVGVVIAAAANPETTIGRAGVTHESGSDLGYALGLLVAGVGGAMLSIVFVAVGVVLGMRAVRD